MKKLYFILLLLTSFANAQIVNIPDANFKSKLIALGVDTNTDGNIQQSEALQTTNLDLTASNISDLTGILNFTNLTHLNCNNNSLTSLDVSGLTSLFQIYCNNNELSSLNVNGLSSLTFLHCVNNNLTSLSINNLPALINFGCDSNQLTSLTITGSEDLVAFYCSDNNLTSLDVSGFPHLSELYCSNNQLTNFNFTNCPSLINLYCENNFLTSLDFTGVSVDTIHMVLAHCSNNLISNFIIPRNCNISVLEAENNLLVDVDFSNSGRISNCNFRFNPLRSVNLKNGFFEGSSNPYFAEPGNTEFRFICVDDNELDAWIHLGTSYNYPNLVVNSYCDFTPGGDYNTITGAVTFDANNNGCDTNDVHQQNIKVNINSGSNTGATFTNDNGNYTYFTQTGSFTITPNIENPSWFTFTPPSIVIPFANNNNNVVSQNFCLTANGVHPDLEVTIVPISGARSGFDSEYNVVYKNKGNQTISGNVAFAYDDSVSDFVSSSVVPNLQSSGLLTYNFTGLLPFESRSFYIVLNVNSPMETPAVNDGDVLHFTASISPIANDETPSDNTFQFNQSVVNSFDPNDITCVEGNRVSPSEIGNYLHYVINFENVGSAAAQNIVVKDIINTAQFDVNTLQLMNSSATVSTKMTGNVAEFIFENINLQPQAHGNVSFKIKSKSTLVAGDTVTQSAGIYFDYNFPVVTDPANTIFQILSNPDITVDESIAIYPNPTKGLINIECNNNIKSIQVYDVQGRILQTNVVNENQASLDISTQSKGVYFIKIISDNGMKVQKIIRD